MLRILLLLIFLSSTSNAEPLYWTASKGGLKYTILGSIHVGDKSMYPLPKAIFDRLKNSHGLIIEADIRQANEVKYPLITTMTEDVVDTNYYNELVGIANLLRLDIKSLLSSPPWSAALQLQMKQYEYLGYTAVDGVDIRIVDKATLWDIPVIGLESLQFQISLFTEQPHSGKELLLSTIDEFDHSESTIHCLINSWKTGDLDKLEQFASITKMPPDLHRAFLSERNLKWANKLSKTAWLPKKSGNYFVVVGMLHLLGEQSLLKLLESDGFRITQISQSSPSNCSFKY
jgi:uncharacterized protein YbaP (TraB family)